LVKVTLLTSRVAKDILVEYMKTFKLENVEVNIVDLPVHSISMLSAENIAKIVSRKSVVRDKLGESEIILIPGSVSGDAKVISDVIDRPVFKASRTIVHLPQVLKYITEGGKLDTIKPAEDIITLSEPRYEYTEAFKVNGLSIPLRGPPIILASEAIARLKGEEFKESIARFLREGAKIIVVGSSFDTQPEELESKVRLVADISYPILVEAPSRSHAYRALDAGAQGVITSCDIIEEISGYLSKDHLLVIGDRSIDSLVKALEFTRSIGLYKVIIDPVVGIPLIDFSSTIYRYSEASKLRVPLWFSSANVIEEVEADSHSLHAILASLALELGASIYSVVEDSYKSIHSTAEAREALRVASQAYSMKSTMRGSYSSLLIVKSSSQPEQAPQEYTSIAEPVNYIEPYWDKRGYLRIFVDHKNKVIIAAYIMHRGGIIAVKGRSATSIARALIRKASLDPEHSAYLGYELSKAELALKLSLPYIQDEPLLKTPWDDIIEESRG